MKSYALPIPEPHPGEILLAEFIQPAELTPYRVAKDAGISQPTMNQLVNGKRSISTETALRLATYFGTSPELWINLQNQYDLRKADRELLPRIQSEVRPLALAVS
ncbi:HigA family addiction module antitoxin [Opitutaceae bacterium]|nr:HigA family addiction module antitoxin [Opitutaceae bacterium]